MEGELGLNSQRKNCGRFKILQEDHLQDLRVEVRGTPFSSARRLRENLDFRCNVRTVQRALHRIGIHHRQPAHKILLTPEQAQARLEFAQINLNRNWENVIFSDEKVFSSSENARRPLWRPDNTRYQREHIVPNKRSNRLNIGYWGWMWSYGPGELVEIGGRLNAHQYIDILQDVMLPTVRQQYPDGDILFVQDNCSIHRTRIVEDWFDDHPEIIRIAWPAKSPDLNPIENLWASTIRHWDDDYDNPMLRNRAILDRHVKNIWDWHRGQNFCQNYVQSMRNRLLEVIQSNGYYTKY